jgi:hypothetical protein
MNPNLWDHLLVSGSMADKTKAISDKIKTKKFFPSDQHRRKHGERGQETLQPKTDRQEASGMMTYNS